MDGVVRKGCTVGDPVVNTFAVSVFVRIRSEHVFTKVLRTVYSRS